MSVWTFLLYILLLFPISCVIACMKESFPTSVLNGIVNCSGSENITCTVSCNTKYVFYDGNTTKSYTCIGSMWTPSPKPDACIDYIDPLYTINVEVLYSTGNGQLASNCIEGHKQGLENNKATLTQDAFDACNNPFVSDVGNINLTILDTTFSGSDLKTEFSITMMDTNLLSSVYDSCRSLLFSSIQSLNTFLDYNSAQTCDDGTTTTIVRKTGTKNKLINSGFLCSSGIKKATVIDNGKDKCVNCPPGTFISGVNSCTPCPKDRFQNFPGQKECKTCPVRTIPSGDQTTCVVIPCTILKKSFLTKVLNGEMACSGSEIMTCTVSCYTGYVFDDGNITKSYTCAGALWTPSEMPDKCINYIDPIYTVTINVMYSTVNGQLAVNCSEGHKQGLQNNIGALTQDVFEVCNSPFVSNVGNITLTILDTTFSGSDFKTQLKITVMDIYLLTSTYESCRNLLFSTIQSQTSFLDYNTEQTCADGTTTTIVRKTGSENQLISSGFMCPSGKKKYTVIDRGQDKCLISCMKESFPSNVLNGKVGCNGSEDITCTVTCHNGYFFDDGTTTKLYTCTGAIWTPGVKPDACIDNIDPLYTVNIQVIYSTDNGQSAANCTEGHRQGLETNIAALTLDVFGACNNPFVSDVGNVTVTILDTTFSGSDLKTYFNITVMDTNLLTSAYESCRSILFSSIQSQKTFLDYNAVQTCADGTATTIVRKIGTENRLISSGFLCPGIKKAIVLENGQEKCLNCPPGTFVLGFNSCKPCPEGRFQDHPGQTECKRCPYRTVPSDDQTTCDDICLQGFRSANGKVPCVSCPESYYWVNETYCERCPESGSTLGFIAAKDVSKCKSPCAKGTFSVTGYEPCSGCPLNFYQDEDNQIMCKQCNASQVTRIFNATNSSDCIDLDNQQQLTTTDSFSVPTRKSEEENNTSALFAVIGSSAGVAISCITVFAIIVFVKRRN